MHTEIRLDNGGVVHFIDLHRCSRDEAKYLGLLVLQAYRRSSSVIDDNLCLKLQEQVCFDVDQNPQTMVIRDCLPSLHVLMSTLFAQQDQSSTKTTFPTYYLQRLYSLNPQRVEDILKKVAGHLNLHITSKLQSSKEPVSDVELLSKVVVGYSNREDTIDMFRLNLRLGDIKKCVSSSYLDQVKSVLDFGGGSGDFLHHLKQQQTTIVEAFVLDIKKWYSKEHEQRYSDLKYVFVHTLDLPFPTQSLDMITVFQVFHHLDNMMYTLKELKRVLKVGGILVVREHDCTSLVDKLAIDVEHLIYEVSIQRNRDACCTYEASYLSKRYLVDTMNSCGFRLINQTSPTGCTRCYYTVWLNMN